MGLAGSPPVKAPRLATTANRGALSKREWQDVRRALQARPGPGVHVVELHGVKIVYAKKDSAQGLEGGRNAGKGARDAHAPARPKPIAPDPAASSAEAPASRPRQAGGNARQRRSKARLEEFLRKKRDLAKETNAMERA